MKRTIALLLVFTMLWTPAFAQTSVVRDVKQQFEAQGANLSGPCGAFLITNEVAKRTGLKLLRKVPGQNRAIPQADGTCKTPEAAPGENGYAVEYIIALPSGFGYDILGDSGGDNGPRWAEETDKVDRNLRHWAEPVNLNGPGTPTPTPTPVPPVSDEVAQRLTHIESTTNSLYAQSVLIATKLEEHIQSTEKFQAAVGNEYKKFGIFVAKYVLPILGGVLGGRYLFGGNDAE